MRTEEMAKLAQLIAEEIRRKPIPMKIVRKSSMRQNRTSMSVLDSTIVKRREDTRCVIREIRQRHKNGGASYTEIICKMRKSPTWANRMKHCSNRSWKTLSCKK